MTKIDNIRSGKQLRKFRESLHDKGQEKFARIIDYSMNRINKIEVKNLPISDKLRKAISINLSELKKK